MNDRHTALLVAAALTACGGSEGTRPEDMSAVEHREAASGEEQEAGEHAAQYDPEAEQTTAGTPRMADFAYPLSVYNPTEHHREQAEEHTQLAAEHQAAAEALESFEEAQCGSFPPETRAACPLLGQLASVEDAPNGVKLAFVEGVRLDAVADHVRCHLAFAQAHGREGMDACPLYLDAVEVGADDASVTLTTRTGRRAVNDLRRRSRAHLSH